VPALAAGFERHVVTQRHALHQVVELCARVDPPAHAFALRTADLMVLILAASSGSSGCVVTNDYCPAEELGNGGRVRWVSGCPGEAPAYAGSDFIIARDGRITAVYLFSDRLP